MTDKRPAAVINSGEFTLLRARSVTGSRQTSGVNSWNFSCDNPSGPPTALPNIISRFMLKYEGSKCAELEVCGAVDVAEGTMPLNKLDT